MRIENNRQNGFLLGCLDDVGHCWSHYCAIWGWAGVFHKSRPIENKNADQNFWLEQDNRAYDIIYSARLIISVLFFSYLAMRWDHHSGPAPRLDSFILSWSLWRVADNLINYVHGPLFGFKNKPGRRESFSLSRAQRRLMLTLIDYCEIVFTYSSIYWLISIYLGPQSYDKGFINPSSALQLSFSTITTVGYGTFAPNSYRADLIAFSEAFAGLLMIGGAIAQMATLLKEYSPLGSGGQETSPVDSIESEGMEVSEDQLWKRRVFPPLITLGSLLALYLAFSLLIPLPKRVESKPQVQHVDSATGESECASR